MNYAKVTAVVVGSVELKQYLKDQRFFQTDKNISILLYVQMAGIGMMIRCAIINAVALLLSLAAVPRKRGVGM